MAHIPTLAELAALQGDKDMATCPKPLSEGQLANVSEAMRLLSAAGRRIDQAQGTLQHCRVPFDVTPFRRVQDCLDEAWQALQPAVMAHCEAMDSQKGRAS